MQTEALDIYQSHLDIVTMALWEKRWDLLSGHLRLPSCLSTLDATIEMTTWEDLKATLMASRRSLSTMQATAYLRLAEVASFANEDRTQIKGTHVTYILSGGNYVLAPYRTRQSLDLVDGVWKAFDLYSEVRNREYTVISPELARQKAMTKAEDMLKEV